jgi:hypothetical protein
MVEYPLDPGIARLTPFLLAPSLEEMRGELQPAAMSTRRDFALG